MTAASRYLVALAERLAAEYVIRVRPRAILLTGSAAEGVSDFLSDLDLIAYYDDLPPLDHLAAVRESVGASDARVIAGGEGDSCLELYQHQGIEVQVAHQTIAAWEREMAAVLERHEPASVTEKALSGLLAGRALHGGDLIAEWQARAAVYPDGLARTKVEHHLRFFPLWLAAEYWDTRDATIFFHQELVETCLNLLAVLAGLNRRYFSSFQFKRLRAFAGDLPLAPERLADRLDELFALPPAAAGVALERLVDETITLVEAHVPEIDTDPARRHLGGRRRPWQPAV